MIQYHAVMMDETGCEFGHTFYADSREEAWTKMQEDFPESRCVQIESPRDTVERQSAVYQRLQRIYDRDEWDLY